FPYRNHGAVARYWLLVFTSKPRRPRVLCPEILTDDGLADCDRRSAFKACYTVFSRRRSHERSGHLADCLLEFLMSDDLTTVSNGVLHGQIRFRIIRPLIFNASFNRLKRLQESFHWRLAAIDNPGDTGHLEVVFQSTTHVVPVTPIVPAIGPSLQGD